ncbi:MAG: GNAT family N-acetyltransferase [Candidatus Promineifilaceae bacterium]
MMDKNEILRLYDEEERRNSVQPPYRREEVEGVVRHVHSDPERLSFIIYSDLTAENADRVIQEQIDWYRTQINGGGLEWKTFEHDAPPDLPQRLAALGFEADEREALLFLDLQNCPDVYLQPPAADVRRITDPDAVGPVVAIQTAVYDRNFDWLEKQLRASLSAYADNWAVYAAYVDDLPVCAAWMSLPANSQFAGLWGGATLPQYRKMGIYTAVVAARAQEAMRRGYRFLTVDAGDMSRPILQKRGFQLLTYTTPYTWKPPQSD